jgi:hypothetical protein
MKAIQVNQVSKKFSQSLKYLMRYVPLDVGRSMLGLKRDAARLRRGEFVATPNVGTPSDVPVLILSAVAGYSVTDELGKVIQVNGYVEKPFRLHDLVMRIRTMVRE